MNWTKEAPTQDGWYWARYDEKAYPDMPAELLEPMLLMVFTGPEDVKWFEDTVNRESYPINDSFKAYWAGPLLPPEVGERPGFVEPRIYESGCHLCQWRTDVPTYQEASIRLTEHLYSQHPKLRKA